MSLEQSVPFSQSSVEVSGCRVSMRRSHSGAAAPTVLYLHGVNGLGELAPFMQNLGRDFDLIVPEHPGFGASEEPAWLDNIHDLAYFYLDFIEQLQLDQVVLVGSSIGGWLAFEIAIRNARNLRALSVLDPAGIYVPGVRRGDIFLWSPEERVRKLFSDQTIADRLLASSDSVEQAEAAIKNQYSLARIAWEPRLFDPHLEKWLHRIRVPTQIIWGAQDQLIPLGYAQVLQQRIGHAQLSVLDPCGHLPPIERPHDVCQLLRTFIGAL